MAVILDVNFRVLKDGADTLGWPGPEEPMAVRRAHMRANTTPAWQDAYTHIRQQANFYASCGFAAINFGPATLGAAGGFSGGYDLKENYRWGTNSEPTGFGTAEDLRSAIGAVHASGMNAYGDLVLHQYDGFDPTKVYNTPDALGTYKGRFTKLPTYFVGAPPNVNVDPVPNSEGNFGFGAMASYVNSTPPGKMLAETIAAAQIQTSTFDFDGYRIDDVKGTNANAVKTLLNSTGIAGLYAFGEYFDGNSNNLGYWVNNDMSRRCAVLDFGTKFNVGNICNNNSRVWMGQLSNIGYCCVDGPMAVTFGESADTDNSPGEQTIWNKILAYAIILMFPGFPRVYYRDWSTDVNCYGLMDSINNLIYCHNNFANGDFVPRLDTHSQVFAMERLGLSFDKPGCVCFYNNDQYNTYEITIQTSYWPNTLLHEYTGKHEDIRVDSNSRITVTVPKNNNGYGYLIFAVWIEPKAYSWTSKQTTQTFYCANDLPDTVGNATNGKSLSVGRVFIAKDTAALIKLELPNTTNWTDTTVLQAELADDAGNTVAYCHATSAKGKTVEGYGKTSLAGWHTLYLTSTDLPTSIPFNLSAVYTGTV